MYTLYLANLNKRAYPILPEHPVTATLTVAGFGSIYSIARKYAKSSFFCHLYTSVPSKSDRKKRLLPTLVAAKEVVGKLRQRLRVMLDCIFYAKLLFDHFSSV